MKKQSPTQRALETCRASGWIYTKTEYRDAHVRHVTHDLFGFCDILALTGGSIVAIQVTSGSNHAARVKKILSLPAARGWVSSGGKIQVWSYALRGGRGKTKEWTCRIQPICHEDFTRAV